MKKRNNPDHYYVLIEYNEIVLTYTDSTGKPWVMYNEYFIRLYRDILDWLVDDGYLLREYIGRCTHKMI